MLHRAVPQYSLCFWSAGSIQLEAVDSQVVLDGSMRIGSLKPSSLLGWKAGYLRRLCHQVLPYLRLLQSKSINQGMQNLPLLVFHAKNSQKNLKKKGIMSKVSILARFHDNGVVLTRIYLMRQIFLFFIAFFYFSTIRILEK